VSQFKKLDNGDWAQNVQLTGSNVPDSQRLPIKILSSTGNEPSIGVPGSTDGIGGSNTSLYTGTYQLGFNSGSWDRWRNNTEGILLASAARTNSPVTPQQTNYNARGVILFLDVTGVSGTGGLKPYIYGVCPVTGKSESIYAFSSTITTIATHSFAFYPSVSVAAFTGADSGVLPRKWFAYISNSDATSYTYSLGYSLIV
jgi:hypothetical protein